MQYRRNASCEDSIKMVKAGSGCENTAKVEQVIMSMNPRPQKETVK